MHKQPETNGIKNLVETYGLRDIPLPAVDTANLLQPHLQRLNTQVKHRPKIETIFNPQSQPAWYVQVKQPGVWYKPALRDKRRMHLPNYRRIYV